MQSTSEKPDENVCLEVARSAVKNESKSAISCEFCGKTFKFKATLRQHEQIHYGIKQHECEMCHRRFLHKSTLKCHLRLHTGEKPYKCSYCPKTFRGQTALNCHIFRHTNEGAKCPVCLKVFATSSIVKQHRKQVHTNERLNVCNLCGMTYKHLKSLRLHLRNHQKRVCPECGVGFDSVYAMLKHRKSHTKEKLPYKCEHCDRAFEDRSKLASHENLRGRRFQCELCCHSFNKPDYLTNHQRRVHWKEMGLDRLKVAQPPNGWNRKGIPKPQRSKKAMKRAEPEAYLDDFAMVDDDGKQSSISDEKYLEERNESAADELTIVKVQPVSATVTCPVNVNRRNEESSDVMVQREMSPDETIFKSEEKANNPADSSSVKALHTSEKANEDFCLPLSSINPKPRQSSKESFICELCGNLYASGTTLAVHRVKQHASARFQCDQCHRTFGFRCFLEKHIRTEHENERVSCKLCDKQFKYAQDLKVHMRHHDDPKPFKCDQCASAFRFPGALRSHRILHQNELPFKCDVCGNGFRFENSLRVHKRLHSGVKQFRCDICAREFATKAPMLRHMKVHENGKEMACSVCGMVYYKKVDLEIHQSKEHPNHESMAGKVKPIYSCEQCGKEFTKKSNLKAHSYTHEEVYRFTCKLCSQSFKQHAGLRNHMINNHKQTSQVSTATAELIDRIENVQPNVLN
ncbi:zinc finger protein 845-like [Anopheles maculipalpis]|uniref:zinc finger protein 845-like n=1 Tax=Anopheles maculipalpis TaxID=1496333 RepID=UPI002159A56F|nr:zinc finger protein 845-like [Anopheles maculipalpis]